MGLGAKKVENHCSRVELRHVDLNTLGEIVPAHVAQAGWQGSLESSGSL